MKKHELLKYAYDNYPKATIGKWEGDLISFTGIYNFIESGRIHDTNSMCVYDPDDKKTHWAEIITQARDRKLIITSEDGVDLYSGMEMYGAEYMGGLKEWRLKTYNNEPFVLQDDSNVLDEGDDFPYVTSPSSHKAFSTREAAENWIEEKNKPKQIIIPHTGGEVIVSKSAITFNTPEKCFSGSYFHQIVVAHQSLQ